MPEILFVGLLVVLHTLSMNWVFLLLNFPMLLWLLFVYTSSPRGMSKLYTATELSDPDVMNSSVRRLVFKIIFHLLHFFAYVYLAVISVVTT